MDSNRWSEVRRLFEEILDTGPSDPRAYLERATGGDESLVREVLSLLEEDRREQTPLDGPLPGLGELSVESPTESEPLRIPEVQVHPYRFLEPVGRGGMGAVFTATRADGTTDRTVALKLVHAGLDSAALLRRFRKEQRILGSLEHPNIARLYDAGQASDGRPFLVMEYVDGMPIDRFREEAGLDVRNTLELVLQVCDAVSHAHQGFVIHRDLKPSNILVNGEGQAKLLDFGIAKLVEADSGEAETRTGLRMMTPEYASPEQIRGEVLTAASDVYSLGMILYELLTGERAVKDREQALARALAPESAPSLPRPSTSVTKGTQDGGGTGEHSTRTARLLKGDLDQVVLKAVRPDPEERYPSVAALADDLRAFLDGRPVSAQPPTLLYRARKFARRRRGGVTAAALVLLSLVLGVIVSTWQARRAAQERDVAVAVSSFLEELFRAPDPRTGLVRDTTRMVDFLAVAEERVRSGLETQLVPKARLQLTLGIVYRNLGRPDRAVPVLRDAVATHGEAYPAGHPDAVEARRLLGLSLAETGDFEEGVAELEAALEAQLALEGAESTRTARMYETVGRAYANAQQNDEALPWLERAVDAHRGRVDPDPVALASALNTLGSVLDQAGRSAEAVPLLEEAADTWSDAGDSVPRGVRQTDEAVTRNNLAQILLGLGRTDEARVQAERAGVLLDSAFTGPHPTKALNLRRRATLLALASDSAPGVIPTADSLYQASLAMEGDLPQEPGAMMFAWNAYGRSLRQWGRLPGRSPLLDSAIVAFGRSVEAGGRDFGAGHPLVMSGRADLGRTLAEVGRVQEGLAEAAVAFDAIEAAVPAGHPMLANATLAYAYALTADGQTAEARALLERKRPDFVASLSEGHPLVGSIDEALEAARGGGGPPL